MAADNPVEANTPRFDRFKTMLRGLRVSGMCVFYQDRDLNVLMVENAPEFWPSRAEIMRQGDRAIFDEKATERIHAAKKGVLAGVESARIEVPVMTGDAPRWFEMTVEPDTDRSGIIQGLFVTAVEITDLVHREQILKTLLREVSHRSKNMLAVIQSVAMQTARFSGSLEEFLLKFRGRIQSLSQSQDLVTDSNWRGARFFELVDRQLARYVAASETQLSRSGDDCYLNPNAALHVGLALHELAVNSAVYGALSDGGGHLSIDASHQPAADNDHLVISWTEHLAGPGDIKTVEAHFGSAVLEKVVPTAVGGSAVYRMSKDIVSYRLEIPDSQFEC